MNKVIVSPRLINRCVSNIHRRMASETRAFVESQTVTKWFIEVTRKEGITFSIHLEGNLSQKEINVFLERLKNMFNGYLKLKVKHSVTTSCVVYQIS